MVIGLFRRENVDMPRRPLKPPSRLREAQELLERARKRAGLSASEAMKLALRETRAARRA